MFDIKKSLVNRFWPAKAGLGQMAWGGLLAGSLALGSLSSAASQVQPQLLWKLSLLDTTGYLGSEAAPAVANDGTVYFATFYGKFCAVSPEGGIVWQFQAGREIHSASCIGDDGTLYFGCRDWKLYALTPAGKLKWTFATKGWVDSSPALAADGTIYFGSWDGSFQAVHPDGTGKWSFATGGVVDSSPAIGADGTIYFGSHDGNFYALKPDGTLRWKFATGGPIPSSPAIGADGRIYFTSMDHNLYALSAGGKELWRRDVHNVSACGPVIDAGGNVLLLPSLDARVFTPEGKETVIFGTPTVENVSPLVAPNGQVFFSHSWRKFEAYDPGRFGRDPAFWSFPTLANLLDSPVMAPDGNIYCMDAHFLYAFRADWGPPPWNCGPWPMFHANARHTGRVAGP